tara:strand:- start:3038 stop:3172 length:135 start_codon:yes stop_codon:yes gene_type:complete
MRQKVYDYIEKPSKKLKKELTTMELKWADKRTTSQVEKKPFPKK